MALPIAEELLHHLRPTEQIAVLSVLAPDQYQKEYLLSQYIPKFSLHELRLIKASDSSYKNIVDAEINKRLQRNTLIELLTNYEPTPRDSISILSNPALTVEYLYDFYMKVKDGHEENALGSICDNTNITIEFLNQHPDLIVPNMAKNKAVTLDLFEADINLFGDDGFIYIKQNPNLTQDFILKYKDQFRTGLSRNLCVTPKFVAETPDITWDKMRLSRNPNFTRKDLDIIMKAKSREFQDWVGEKEYYELELAVNRNSSIEDVKYAITKITEYQQGLQAGEYYGIYITQTQVRTFKVRIAKHPKMTIDIVRENINFFDRDDIWEYLSENRSISIYDILAHPELPWVPSSVNSRLDVDEFLLESPEYPYKQGMCKNRNITFDFIERNNLLNARDSWKLFENAYTHDPEYVKLANEIINMQ